MGINRPSLYAAFGNKEALFREALDRYREGIMAFLRDVISQPTVRGVAERLLSLAADMVTDPRTRMFDRARCTFFRRGSRSDPAGVGFTAVGR